ncbi:unnamed protein product [Brassica rapa]|uniref:Uncharacterized protein n=1 Tax=Brassica campestris TaxID=3711 RepID=A0A8D9LXV9_BRACM|nr:unnamed protein product [Brassica rapa]
MKRTRAALLCLLTTLLLISAADSTVMRLEMTHRDTLFPTSVRRIGDIIGSDQKRHSLISHKRTTATNGGARLSLRSGFDYGRLSISPRSESVPRRKGSEWWWTPGAS